MAGAQSFSPPSVSPSRPKRRFTLEQANRSLPLVKRIVADIVKTHDSATKLNANIEGLPAVAKDRASLQVKLDSTLDRLRGYVDELSEVGCELKDYQVGLIDYVARHKGHDVYLCWRLGEERITHWHEIQAGFGGRQPVSMLRETD